MTRGRPEMLKRFSCSLSCCTSFTLSANIYNCSSQISLMTRKKSEWFSWLYWWWIFAKTGFTAEPTRTNQHLSRLNAGPTRTNEHLSKRSLRCGSPLKLASLGLAYTAAFFTHSCSNIKNVQNLKIFINYLPTQKPTKYSVRACNDRLFIEELCE